MTWLRDVHGNVIASVSFAAAANELVIINDVRVQRTAPFPTRQLHVPFRLDWPPRYDPLESAMVNAYLTMQYPEELDELRNWLAAHFSPQAQQRFHGWRSIAWTRRPSRETISYWSENRLSASPIVGGCV